jgi:hypothetical protein
LLEDLVVLGEATDPLLGKEHAPIGFDVEDATPARDQLDFVIRAGFDVGRQTGGLGSIVSNPAVRDRDLHIRSSAAVKMPGSAGASSRSLRTG